MKANSQDLDRPSYLMIYESELRVVAGLSAAWGTVETGLDLYGLWTNGGLPVILLVTAPGPNAVHRVTYFEQDIDFFCRVNQIMTGMYGLQWIGTGHHHHSMSRGPSSWDVRQVQGVTKRNGASRWCEIITTTCDDNVYLTRAWLPRKMTRAKDCARIRVDAYLYTEPQHGQKISIPLRILPGISPFRPRVLADGSLDPADIGAHNADFPMERIDYDSFDFESGPIPETDKVLQALAVQCKKLPRQAQNDIRFRVEEDHVVAGLPLPDDGTAYVKYGINPPHMVQSIYVKDGANDSVLDVTGGLLAKGGDVKLGEIYEMLTSRKRKDPYCRPCWHKVWSYIEALTRREGP